MSKKLAEGIDALVLDVKYGSGAFMKTQNNAIKLAQTLVDVGESFNKPTIALITNMETPTGLAIGNWLEVQESIDVLQGTGPFGYRVPKYIIVWSDVILGAVGVY